MLRISDRSTATCVVVRVEGAVSGDEYDDFADAVEDATDEHGHIDLVVELLGPVTYGDKDAFEEDWEFAFGAYRKVRRAAFVGDKGVVKAMLKAFSPFTRTSERFFEAGQLDAAIEWATAPD